MGLLRSSYRKIRHAHAPALRWFRKRWFQGRIQHTVRLAPEDRSDRRRRWHVLVDLIHTHLPAERLHIAEIGIHHGHTARHIARYCPQVERIYAIDLKPPPKGEDRLRGLECVTFIQGYSDACAKRFEDESLDLVFIDADHSEEWVLRDLAAWLPKVKPGGIVAGHDYGGSRHPGVKAAVDRVFQRHAHGIRLEANKVWWTFR